MPSDDWREDKREALDVFKKLVYPKLQLFQDAKIIYLEECTCEFCQICDREYGIDALIRYSDGFCVTSALRTQRDNTPRNWRTFTIRATRSSGAITEWQKLTNPKFLSPFITIQSYVDKYKDRLLGSAFASTENIVDYIRNHPDYSLFEQGQYPRTLLRSVSNAWFFYVPWDRIEVWEEYPEIEKKESPLLDSAMFVGLPEVEQEEELP